MKLLYWFDFGDDWIFRISKRAKSKMEEDHIQYPRVTKEFGPKPVQYPRSGKACVNKTLTRSAHPWGRQNEKLCSTNREKWA